MILFKRDAEKWEVRQVEGEPYPGRDSENAPCYINTHFESEDDAWNSLFEEAQAYVYLSGAGVTRAKVDLLKAREEASDAAEDMSKVSAALRNRERLHQAAQYLQTVDKGLIVDIKV